MSEETIEDFYMKVKNGIYESDGVFFLKLPIHIMAKESNTISDFVSHFRETTGYMMFALPENVSVEIISNYDFDRLTGVFKEFPKYEVNDLIKNAGA